MGPASWYLQPVYIPPTLYQGGSVQQSDGVSLLRLYYKRHWGFCRSLRHLLWGKASCHVVRTLKQPSDECNHMRTWIGPTQLNHSQFPDHRKLCEIINVCLLSCFGEISYKAKDNIIIYTNLTGWSYNSITSHLGIKNHSMLMQCKVVKKSTNKYLLSTTEGKKALSHSTWNFLRVTVTADL